MLTNEQMADAIDDAADLMEKGWFALKPQVIRSGPGPVFNCALTALIGTLVDQHHNNDANYTAISTKITEILGLPDPGSMTLVTWNNSHDNSQPVLDGFRKAAKVLRNEA